MKTKELKFRASQWGDMCGSIKDKPDVVPAGAKTILHQIWVENNYNRRKSVVTHGLTKGIEQEEESFNLLTKVTGKLFVKNTERRSNDYWTGEPDTFEMPRKTVLWDAKCPEHIFSFHQPSDTLITKSGLLTKYGWQLMIYMDLWDIDEAKLAYTLVDMPEWILNGMLYSATYKFKGGEDDPAYQKYAEELIRMHSYGDIPAKDRVKIFTLFYSEEWMELARIRAKALTNYYNKIKL